MRREDDDWWSSKHHFTQVFDESSFSQVTIQAHKQRTISHFVKKEEEGPSSVPMTREHLRLATEEFNSAPDGLPLNSLCIDLAGGAENIGDGCSLSEQKLRHLEIHIELLDTHPTISGKCALS